METVSQVLQILGVLWVCSMVFTLVFFGLACRK